MYIVLCQMKRKVVAATGSYDIYTRYLRRLMERSTRGWREEVLHYATTTTKWRRYCLRPGTLSVSMVIKHDLFFFLILIYLFLNTMSALEINHVFTHDAFYYKWCKISAWIYITLGFTFISTLKVTRSLSLALLRHLWTFFVFVFFLSAVVSATWSNLVAYLWHSLTFVLVDVGEWCRRAADPPLPASLQDCYRFT